MSARLASSLAGLYLSKDAVSPSSARYRAKRLATSHNQCADEIVNGFSVAGRCLSLMRA